MDTLRHDLRYAVRQLRSRPRFTVSALVTLALGIGANSAVFSLANWIVLRPVPAVHDAGRLVVVEFRNGKSTYPASTSYPDLADLRARTSMLSGLAGATAPMPVAVQADGEPPRYLRATFASATYFDVLGTRLTLGHPFTRADEIVSPRSPVAVISHRLWRKSFGGDAGVVGRYLTVHGVRTRIIGVAPDGFRGTERLGDTDIWIPAAAAGTLGSPLAGSSLLESREAGLFTQLIGRLAPGATVAQARTQLRTAAANLVAAYPKARRYSRSWCGAVQ